MPKADMIRGLTVEEFKKKVEGFHTNVAPGVLTGGYMVELGCRNLPPGILFEVICETGKCLPDAVQLLTPCTVGNQRLRIIDLGRYAVTFYDKYTGEGVRVYLNHNKLEKFPEVKAWFLNLKSKKEQDFQKMQDEVEKAGERIHDIEKVHVDPALFRNKVKKINRLCPICNEMYQSEKPYCPACGPGPGRLPGYFTKLTN
jgi:formylmethanofuran dehydrogenase subunit E